MEAQWKDHTLRVTGNWTARWLFLAPVYQLWLDEVLLDEKGGPRMSPLLEAIYEDEEGELHHIQAELLSIVGFRPNCEITIEGNLLIRDKVRVENFLNPFLMLFILLSTAAMLYVGPDVLRQFLSM
jgi:hypothetical protein